MRSGCLSTGLGKTYVDAARPKRLEGPPELVLEVALVAAVKGLRVRTGLSPLVEAVDVDPRAVLCVWIRRE